MTKQQVSRALDRGDSMTIDTIIDILHREDRAATYGAVAGLMGIFPRNVMEGRPRDAMNSWVVNGMTLLPTHYEIHEVDERLMDSVETHGVFRDADTLSEWLNEKVR